MGTDGLPTATDDQLVLASVGALLVNELIHDSRGMVEKPMSIQFVSGGPRVELYKLPEEGPAAPPK